MKLKSKNSLKTLCLLGLVFAVVSCNNTRDYKSSSRATGWRMNAKQGGFQYNPAAKEQETAPGLVFIEGGTFTMLFPPP